MPSAWSQRPLQMPDGEHQIIVAAGATRASTNREISPSITRLSYHYGITDSLTYVFPAGVSYGGSVAEDFELAVYGGLTGLTVVHQFGPGYSGDPRLFPPTEEDQWLLSASLGLSARRVLSGSSALTAEAALSPWASTTRVSFLSANLSAVYVVDLTSWLSAAVVASAFGGPGFATWRQLGVSTRATYLATLSPPRCPWRSVAIGRSSSTPALCCRRSAARP